MFWKKKEFKPLQDQWYQALSKSGFRDIEKDELHLKQRATNAYHQAGRLEREIKEEYFHKLVQCMRDHAHEFDDGMDYYVMHKFSIGWKNFQIVQALALMGKPRHRKTIMYIRRKYEHKWGLRAWKPHQLRSQKKKR